MNQRDVEALRADFEERLRFETLLADLSAHFVNLPGDRLDGEIETAKRRVCEYLSNAPDFTGATFEKTFQWVDPVVGLIWNQPLGQRWVFGLPANVGGFGAASKIAVDLFPNLQFQVAKGTWLGAGWRLLYMDYRNAWDDPQPALNPDAFLYDLPTTGPVVGMVFRL